LTIARRAAKPTLLLGTMASKSNVLPHLRSSALIHIAAHAVVVDADPMQSFVVLAPDEGDSGALYLHEILDRRLDSEPLVVLAGCRTSSAGEGYDAGSLALAIIAAGASSVVGTLWDINDSAAGAFSTAFHARLQSGASPAEATRAVQLQMLRSRVPNLSAVSAWGAFQISGSGR
jgi:CHAT domain-containing protein